MIPGPTQVDATVRTALAEPVRSHTSAENAVTVHRIGVLEASSLTARIIPVTGSPFKINLALRPRYWAKRQRRASDGFVISMVCIWHFLCGRGMRNRSATAEIIYTES